MDTCKIPTLLSKKMNNQTIKSKISDSQIVPMNFNCLLAIFSWKKAVHIYIISKFPLFAFRNMFQARFDRKELGVATLFRTHSLPVACEIGKERRRISEILQKKERIVIS